MILAHVVIIAGFALIGGFVVGHLVALWDMREVMDADNEELAALRLQVRELSNDLAIAREEYGNWDWITDEALLQTNTPIANGR